MNSYWGCTVIFKLQINFKSHNGVPIQNAAKLGDSLNHDADFIFYLEDLFMPNASPLRTIEFKNQFVLCTMYSEAVGYSATFWLLQTWFGFFFFVSNKRNKKRRVNKNREKKTYCRDYLWISSIADIGKNLVKEMHYFAKRLIW